MREYKGIQIEASDDAMPFPGEEVHTKILRNGGQSHGIPIGFMCKRCGAEWLFNGKRCHEPYCTFHLKMQ